MPDNPYHANVVDEMPRLSLADEVASWDEPTKLAFLQSLTPEEATLLLYYWPFWARDNQLPPTGDWRTWLIMTGRGWGKNRTAGEYIRKRQEQGYGYFTFVGATASDVRDYMVEGESGIINVCPPWNRPIYEPSKRKVTWPNGARAILYSADEPERLRGAQHDTVWCDELAAWRYPGAWTQLSLGLRLSRDPRAVVTTTPKPIPLLHEIMKRKSTVQTEGSTYDNLANLPTAFIEEILERYEGTHLGLQELWGRLLDKVEGALWDRDDIDHSSVPDTIRLSRCVVGVDPSAASSAAQQRKGTHRTNECGIIVAAKGTDGHCYVLDDQSLKGSPNEWANRVVNAFDFHSADRIVAEVNNGGAMVEETIKTVRLTIPYEAVFASRGKVTRADPVVALYQQHKVHHTKAFDILEDQLTSWRPGEDSPDRLDALVWAVSHLMVRTIPRLPVVLSQALVRVNSPY